MICVCVAMKGNRQMGGSKPHAFVIRCKYYVIANRIYLRLDKLTVVGVVVAADCLYTTETIVEDNTLIYFERYYYC